MLNVRMGSYIDLSFDFRLLHVLVKALLHVKKFLVFLGQQFLHGGNRCRPENLILVFLGCLLCAVRVILNLKCTRAILTSTWGHDYRFLAQKTLDGSIQ